jgi:tetratricopeptide (TPR) repeat protein
MIRWLTIGYRLTLISVFVTALVIMTRIAVADHLASADTIADLQQSLRWWPLNTKTYERLAFLQSRAGDENSARASLQAAIRIEPTRSALWIDLARIQENAQELAAAEASLKQAVARDRLFAPIWALTNFYARRGNLQQFWPAAQGALDISYDQGLAVWSLAHQIDSDAKRVLGRLKPRDPADLVSYLKILLDRDDLAGALFVSERIPAQGPHHEALLRLVDALLGKQEFESAHHIWERLFPNPRGSLLFNAAFDSAPRHRGFDWRLPGLHAVAQQVNATDQSLQITFDGTQGLDIVPASQLVLLPDAGTYELRWTSRVEARIPAKGLTWMVTDAQGHEPVAQSGEMNMADWRTSTLSFRVDRPQVVQLRLRAARPYGGMRFEGDLWIRDLTLVQLDSAEKSQPGTNQVALRGR